MRHCSLRDMRNEELGNWCLELCTLNFEGDSQPPKLNKVQSTKYKVLSVNHSV
jgi:hypothetical protein